MENPKGAALEPADDGGVWMTKAELAHARRISVASADRLVRKQRWRKQPGNDGRARVLVPTDWAAGPKAGPKASPEDWPTTPESRPTDGLKTAPEDGPTDWVNGPKDRPTGESYAINVLGEAIAVLREQLARAEARADRADRLQEQVTRLEIELAVERAARRSWLFRALWRGRGG